VNCDDILAVGLAPSGVLCVWCPKTNALNGTTTWELMGCCEYNCQECLDPGLTCTTTADGDVYLSWDPNIAAHCCDRIEILVDGMVVISQPGSTPPLSVPFNCGELGHGLRTICVQCVDANGNVKAQACCEIDCGPHKNIVPGDCNGNGNVDFSDVICMLRSLFLGFPPLPCGDGTLSHPSNTALLDFDNSGTVDLTDAIAQLICLFLGPPPGQSCPNENEDCVFIPECPPTCGF
jgi:hypothetical protein